jgi:lipid A 4'-phosphatase
MKLRAKSWMGWVGSLAVSMVVFALWPELDLWVALRFYDSGRGFPANQWHVVQFIYQWTPRIGMVLTAAVLMVLILRMFAIIPIPRWLWRKCLAWLLVLVIGVGLVVHEGLKNQVGRPRPHQIEPMGGSAPFIPAMQWSTHCARNCSFVSGHAAVGFALLAFGMWSAPAMRRRWWFTGVLVGSAIGWVRMAQGGHFLSDVLFSLLAIWGSSLLIRQFWLYIRLFAFKRRLQSFS